MSPSHPEKPPQILFQGDPDKWSDARNTIELYLSALDPPLIGYLRVDNYDGTQTFTLEDGTVHPPIHEPATPAVPPSATSDSGAGGDDDPEGGGHRKKKKKRSQQLTLDPSGGSITVFREMSKVTLVIHQCMDENIRLLINGKKPFDAWKILNDRYGTAEAVDRVRLLKEINAFKLNIGDDPGIFVAKLDVLLDRYEQATGTVHGDMGRSLMLREKLPSEWDSLVQSWHGQKNVIPYQQLRGLVERQKVTPVVTTPRKETALATKATTGDPPPSSGKKRGCFNCHQQGHDAVDCPDLSQAERDKRRADVEAWRAQKAERDKNKKAKGKPSQKPRQADRVSLTKDELAAIINNTAKEAASEVEKRLQRDNRSLESDSNRGHRRDDRDDRRGYRDRSPGRRGRSRSRARSRSPRRENDYRRHDSDRNRGTPRRSRSPDRRSSFSPGEADRKNVQRALFAHASVQQPYAARDAWYKDQQAGHDQSNYNYDRQGPGWREQGNWPPQVKPVQYDRVPYQGREDVSLRHHGHARDDSRREYRDSHAGGYGWRDHWESPHQHATEDRVSSGYATGDGRNDRERREQSHGRTHRDDYERSEAARHLTYRGDERGRQRETPPRGETSHYGPTKREATPRGEKRHHESSRSPAKRQGTPQTVRPLRQPAGAFKSPRAPQLASTNWTRLL